MKYTLWNNRTGKYLNGGDRWQVGGPRETFNLGTCRRWKKYKYADRPEVIIVKWNMVPEPVK
jgi:hypothetical protein